MSTGSYELWPSMEAAAKEIVRLERELAATKASLRAELATAREQFAMDGVRFTEMQRWGTKLEIELADAREDSKRLDMLQAAGFHHLHHETGDCLGWEWTITSKPETENDVRAALDAAKESKP